MGQRVGLVVHPGSGVGAAARIAGTAAARLRPAVGRLDLLAVGTTEQFRDRMHRSRAAGLDALVVLGGDGAIHHAVQLCAGTGVALGVVPCGSGNDFARALGVPSDPMAALDAIVAAFRNGHRRRIDLGWTGESWFGTVLCSGFDAAVNERANLMTWPPGPRRYDLAIVAQLAAFRPRMLTVVTETDRRELAATLVAIGNTGWYGGGIPICSAACPDDGLFDITIVGRATRRELLRLFPSLRAGKHVNHPAVQTFRARQVMLSGNDWPVYADGEGLGSVPVSATCVEGALTILH